MPWSNSIIGQPGGATGSRRIHRPALIEKSRPPDRGWQFFKQCVGNSIGPRNEASKRSNSGSRTRSNPGAAPPRNVALSATARTNIADRRFCPTASQASITISEEPHENRHRDYGSVPDERCYTATLNLIPSFGACTRSCLVPRYRSVVCTDAWPSSSWICSSSPPAARHIFAHDRLKVMRCDAGKAGGLRVGLEQLPDDLLAQGERLAPGRRGSPGGTRGPRQRWRPPSRRRSPP